MLRNVRCQKTNSRLLLLRKCSKVIFDCISSNPVLLYRTENHLSSSIPAFIQSWEITCHWSWFTSTVEIYLTLFHWKTVQYVSAYRVNVRYHNVKTTWSVHLIWTAKLNVDDIAQVSRLHFNNCVVWQLHYWWFYYIYEYHVIMSRLSFIFNSNLLRNIKHMNFLDLLMTRDSIMRRRLSELCSGC